MSLQVFVAHTGHRLEADTTVLSSLDSLRSWIAKSTGIPPQDQILLTVRGKHVKVQALLTEVPNPLPVPRAKFCECARPC